MNYFEIDYDEQSDLLFKLTRQTIEKFRINLADNKLMNVVQFHKKDLGSYIYFQILKYFHQFGYHYCDRNRMSIAGNSYTFSHLPIFSCLISPKTYILHI